jgi:hypothetical protein
MPFVLLYVVVDACLTIFFHGKPREAFMTIRTLTVIGIAAMSIGCGFSVNGPGSYNDGDHSSVITDNSYVNTYLSIPSDVEELIASTVRGYFSPKLSRYCDYLYPTDLPYNSNDLPCNVRSDFNGDGYLDYAFLFSEQEWDHGEWFLTTKMVVVLSTYDGWTIGADMVLGTVTGDASVPIEEYWSIFLIPRGSHSFTTYTNGVKVTKTITLNKDAFFLASLDPAEEAIFYADGGDVFEMSPDGTMSKKAALGKKAVATERMIPFNKNIDGREKAMK